MGFYIRPINVGDGKGIKRLAAIRNGKYENEYLMARINPAHTK